MWGHGEKVTVYKPGRVLLPVAKLASSLTLDFLASKTVEQKFLLLWSWSLWYRVLAAWADCHPFNRKLPCEPLLGLSAPVNEGNHHAGGVWKPKGGWVWLTQRLTELNWSHTSPSVHLCVASTLSASGRESLFCFPDAGCYMREDVSGPAFQTSQRSED